MSLPFLLALTLSPQVLGHPVSPPLPYKSRQACVLPQGKMELLSKSLPFSGSGPSSAVEANCWFRLF
jgi:hypothetical protein